MKTLRLPTPLVALVPVAFIALSMIGCSQAADIGNTGKTDAAGQSAQRVYLDPETGKIIDHPPASAEVQGAPAHLSAERATRVSGGEPRYTPYVAEDGTKMLAVSPEAMSAETMVRCADGSTRSAHMARDAGPKEAAALCAQPPQDH